MPAPARYEWSDPGDYLARTLAPLNSQTRLPRCSASAGKSVVAEMHGAHGPSKMEEARGHYERTGYPENAR
jgi:hypothetical protein